MNHNLPLCFVPFCRQSAIGEQLINGSYQPLCPFHRNMFMLLGKKEFEKRFTGWYRLRHGDYGSVPHPQGVWMHKLDKAK